MAIPTRVDHVQTAIDRIPHQFSDKPTYIGFIRSWAEEGQLIEDLLIDLLEFLDVRTVTGVTLDLFGKLLNVPRGDLEDEDYRQAIFNRISLNNATGDINNTIELLLLISGRDMVQIEEHYPRSQISYISGEEILSLADTLQNIKVAGTNATLAFKLDPENTLIPTEPNLDTALLVDGNGDFIITGDGDRIRVAIQVPVEGAILAEFGDSEGLILAEAVI